MNIPKCDSATRHRWKPVGGVKENPGYFGIGGAAIRYTEQCNHCGMERSKVFGDVNQSGNRNHGFRYNPID
jgi:hypothetical protein